MKRNIQDNAGLSHAGARSNENKIRFIKAENNPVKIR